jgi:hypothetical protein
MPRKSLFLRRLPPTALSQKKPMQPEFELPAVDGIVTADQIRATGQSIAELQRPSGQIPWFPGGHCDPWNHVETAMALDVVGLHDKAAAAYGWLRDVQLPEGSWYQYYNNDGVEQDKFDANTIAYIAVGVWHHWLLTGDREFLTTYWSVVDRAIEWVLALQRPAGDIVWARHSDGTPFSFSLLTGSSSISHSLKAAIAVADELGHDRPGWRPATARLATCIRDNEAAFAPKKRWAMDWYYPVMTGVVRGQAGIDRMRAGEDKFIIRGAGVRCVANQDWVTSAETCEAVLAYLAVDQTERALELFEWAQCNRDADGAYFTGMVFPQRANFPGGERSAYTAAAIILAADALSGASPASRLLWAHDAVPDVEPVSV